MATADSEGEGDIALVLMSSDERAGGPSQSIGRLLTDFNSGSLVLSGSLSYSHIYT